MLAYDHEYLYLGLSVSRPKDTATRSSRNRGRANGELADQDRVELVIDVDRDYATYYKFTIDHTGRTAESCWHDATWNPEWFVASGGDESAWTAEAAIPLARSPPSRPAKPPPGPWACSGPCPASGFNRGRSRPAQT